VPFGALRAEVQRRLGDFLKSEGFSETRYEYSEQEFGNEILDLKNGIFGIRFTQDRGPIGIELWTQGGVYRDASALLVELGLPKPPSPPDFNFKRGFSFEADHLMTEWPRLKTLLRTKVR